MVALHNSNPVMAGLFFLSLVASSLFLVTRHIMRAGGPSTPLSLASGLGAVAVWSTWLIFVPVNVWAHLSGDSDSWIFGSETFDGGVVESLTLVFYVFAVGQALRLFRRAETLFGPRSAGLWRLILGLGLAGFVVMIGEEMSWGQHLLGFRTPTELGTMNLQGEANIHNLISPRVYDAVYQMLGWTLILMPAIATFWRSAPSTSVTTFLRGLFAWPFTYPLLISSGILLQHEVFEELSEMVLAIAVFQTLLAFGDATTGASIKEAQSPQRPGGAPEPG